jgi:hypothetical protein
MILVKDCVPSAGLRRMQSERQHSSNREELRANVLTEPKTQQETCYKCASTWEVGCEEVESAVPDSGSRRVAPASGGWFVDIDGIFSCSLGDRRIVAGTECSPIDSDDSLCIKIL